LVFVILSESEESRFELVYEILHGVYPEPKDEILRVAQDDNRRRVQDDSLRELL
jgi:hypothetical protein